MNIMLEKLQKVIESRNALLESIESMIVITDMFDDTIIFMNKKMKDLFNFDNTIIGKKCWKHLNVGCEERCSYCPKNDPECYSGKPYSWEFHSPIVNRDYRIVCSVIDWSDGAKVFLEQCDDITEVKAATAEAQRTADEKTAFDNLVSILNGLDALIYVTDPETDELLFVNDNMIKHFDLTEDCIGQPCYKFLQKGMNERCDFCPCNRLRDNPGETVIWEEHNTVTDRYYRNVDRYIDWPDGRKVHLQHTIDITEHKEIEQKIAEKNAQLEAALRDAQMANHAKSAFLANMSHEIRTPMNAILGITEMQLRNAVLPPEMVEGLEKVYEAGDLLLHIVNDILDLSKIESGKMEIIPIKYDITDLINDSVQVNRIRYESKPIDFFLELDENTPLNLFGDELRIKQVLNNILSNAYKYTDKGEIRMTVTSENFRDDADGRDVCLVITVCDTGHGMTGEQLDMLFDEYTRFNMDANRTTVGTGLGMSITKNLITLMGGDITVSSESGVGSVFTVRLPQKRVNNLICGREMSDKLNNFRFHSSALARKGLVLREYMPYGSVLIVDDVESNIYVTRGMLAPYCLKIDSVTSGFDAIERIKAGHTYDVIFMDHMMPQMDGIETVKRLRDMGYIDYIVALTANALIGQSDVFLKCGFDGYLSKPIDSRELNHILNEFIRNKKPPEVVKAARSEQLQAVHEEQPAQADSVKRKDTITELEQYFILDAVSVISSLEDFMKKPDWLSSNAQSRQDDLNSYEIVVHGIKSALANIGRQALSDVAYKLELAAKNGDTGLIREETPVLIKELKALLEVLQMGDVEA